MNAVPLHRHQLAWLTPDGWAAVLAAGWDEEARACLAHWARQRLPLVVTRQQGAPAGRIALGLPAPACWGRRRLLLCVARAEVSYFDEFPRAHALTRRLPAAVRAAWQRLCAGLQARGAVARVHGSHGWQLLTGLDHVRPGSDVDLTLRVDAADQADAAVSLLAAFTASRPRLDGELVFAGGEAVAWREWQAWRAGQVTSVLVKRIDGAGLVSQPLPAWRSCSEAKAA
jgi:phosphoribosyl-dephospho-CoA transferase